ncbi:DUF5667 domain-containing protein [Patescibacteria group bacterium AH-259-L07]|nr:DUF5667 domain-containing protein [Patescibacteria group bacterium AH-259-L07]
MKYIIFGLIVIVTSAIFSLATAEYAFAQDIKVFPPNPGSETGEDGCGLYIILGHISQSYWTNYCRAIFEGELFEERKDLGKKLCNNKKVEQRMIDEYEKFSCPADCPKKILIKIDSRGIPSEEPDFRRMGPDCDENFLVGSTMSCDLNLQFQCVGEDYEPPYDPSLEPSPTSPDPNYIPPGEIGSPSRPLVDVFGGDLYQLEVEKAESTQTSFVEIVSQGITPNSFFYFFDTLFEKVSIFFTFNPEKKASKAMTYAAEKVAEAQAMASENNTKGYQTARDKHTRYSNIALSKIDAIQKQDKDTTEITKQYNEQARASRMLFSQLKRQLFGSDQLDSGNAGDGPGDEQEPIGGADDVLGASPDIRDVTIRDWPEEDEIETLSDEGGAFFGLNITDPSKFPPPPPPEKCPEGTTKGPGSNISSNVIPPYCDPACNSSLTLHF